MYLQKCSKKIYFFQFGMFFPIKKCYTVHNIFIFKGETL